MTPWARRLGRTAAATSVLLSAAWAAAIDTVWIGTPPNAAATEVTILRIEEGRIYWQTKTGNPGERALDTISKIKADGEAALNEAEEAFEAQKWDVAAKAYERAANSAKDWVKDRAGTRLLVAAQKSNNFPAMSAAFGILAVRDPVNAAQFRPAIPADKAQVTAALPGIQNALRQRPTSVLLKGFLADLYIAAGDFPKAQALLTNVTQPELLVPLAKLQVQNKDFAGAQATIERNKALFVTPDLQADALFALAEAKAGLAGADPAKKQDAALAYMRVVGHFGNSKSPTIKQCLLKTAALMEETSQFAEAAALYQQAIDDFGIKDPEAAPLKAKVTELTAKAKPAAAPK